jgi:hypothetical protein
MATLSSKVRGTMRVAVFNTSNDADWRWRIVNYAGETIAESR